MIIPKVRKLKKAALLTILGFFLIVALQIIEIIIESEPSIEITSETFTIIEYGFLAFSAIVFVIALNFAMKRSTYYESRASYSRQEIDDAWSQDRKKREKEKIARTAHKDKENFAQINFNLESELEAVLEIKYSKLAQTKTRLFFGKEGRETIYSRDYLESSKSNFVHIKILPSKKQHSTQWVKKGTREIGDNFEAGYTIEIFLRDAEPELRKYLIDILNSNKFGCLPTARTIHAHLDDDHPNEDKAKEILKNILDKISRKSMTDNSEQINEEIGKRTQQEMDEALKKIPPRTASESENYRDSECSFCKKQIAFPDDFTCKFCKMKFCSNHIQLEKHDCKKTTPVKHVRKRWLRKYGLNISSGKFKVVCDECGYNSDFSLIEDAEKKRDIHLKNTKCPEDKVFLDYEES